MEQSSEPSKIERVCVINLTCQSTCVCFTASVAAKIYYIWKTIFVENHFE